MRKISSTLFLSSSVFAFLAMAPLSTPVFAQEVQCAAPVVVDSEPPPLPAYDQPPVPGPDYVWTPGYWAWSDDEDDYYWVPGTWVLPPREGLLWTPGYWAWAGGSYLFHPGYWGDEVGYYGGVDYGYGYGGDGFDGGHWDQGHFVYNRELRGPRSFVSFNGGTNGTQAHPTSQQKAFSKQQHFAPTALQKQNLTAASKDKSFFSKDNHGKPAVGATSKAGVFKGPGVTTLKTGVTTGGQQPGGAPNGNSNGNAGAPQGLEHHEHELHSGTSGVLPSPHPGASKGHSSGAIGANPTGTNPIGAGQHLHKQTHMGTSPTPQPKPKLMTHPVEHSSAGPHPQPHPMPHPMAAPHPAPHPMAAPHPTPHPTAAPHPAPHPQKQGEKPPQ
jgi:hypothetical protein